MFPIQLDLAQLRVALVGNGDAILRRLHSLYEDGAQHVAIYADAPSAALAEAASRVP